jgi:transposase
MNHSLSKIKIVQKIDKEKAIELMEKGLSYQETATKTGVGVATLRTWKMRHLTNSTGEVVQVPKAKTTTKAKPEKVPNKAKTTTKAKQPKPEKVPNIERETLQVDLSAMVEKYERISTEYATAKMSVETLEMENEALKRDAVPTAKHNDTPLIVAVVALHLSAVYGVGEILSGVFHTYIMGYLTAAVFVSAGLIMFASNKFAVGVSWLVLCATFLLESYCNYLTIYMRMEGAELAKFQQYTNTDYLFLCIAVFVPLVNLALEYLLFKQADTE